MQQRLRDVEDDIWTTEGQWTRNPAIVLVHAEEDIRG
jgi:hypothetical protein